MRRTNDASGSLFFTVSFVVILTSASPALRAIPPDVQPSNPLQQRVIDLEQAHTTTPQATETETVTGDGPPCFPPPLFSNQGGDTCNAATVVPLVIGEPGAACTTLIEGDNARATGPDCGSPLASGAILCHDDNGGPGCDPSVGTVWWEAFSLDRCATVTIRLCGTDPVNFPSSLTLTDTCSADGAACGPFLTADAWTRGFCADRNMWMRFDGLPPGTYYYPVFSDASDPDFRGRGPYRLTITAEACPGLCSGCFGACCDVASSTCSENVPKAQCSGPGQQWMRGLPCCAALCQPSNGSFDAEDVELLSWIPIDQFPGAPHTANEMWGYVSASGREYAVIGFTTGTGFVEVTDPRNPIIVGFVDGGVDTVWRDMAVYRRHAYVVSDGIGVGLQIMDLTDIDAGVVTLLNNTDLGAGLITAHNVFINPDSGFLYLCLSNLNSFLGLVAVDLADPVHPTISGVWTDSDPIVRCHDVQVVSYTDGPLAGREIAFCFAEDDGLRIVDVTDKNNMFRLSKLIYPNTTYTHQGWLGANHRFLFIDDELDERNNPQVTQTTTYVVDVRDLNHPVLATTFTNGLCTIDHNLMVRGKRVYEANYTSGLRVFDVHDVNAIREVGHFDTHPEDNLPGFAGAWGVFTLPSGTVLLSDRQRGLFVLCDSPLAPIAQLRAQPGSVDCLQPIHLDASGSTHCDPARSIVLYEWDLQFDGVHFTSDASSSQPTLQIGYPYAGRFNVAVRVTDDVQAQDIASTMITVKPGANCVCRVPSPPQAAGCCPDLGHGTNVRYVSFRAGDPGVRQAIRVTFQNLPPPFDILDGQTMWVGPPTEKNESGGSTVPVAGLPDFQAATLQCDPFFADFGALGDVHVYHRNLIPGATYRLQAIGEACDLNQSGNFSTGLPVTTSRWGDLAGPFDTAARFWTPADGAVDIGFDVMAVIDKFAGRPGAPIKARADLVPATPDQVINVTDFLFALDAFRGRPYPFKIDPQPCSAP